MSMKARIAKLLGGALLKRATIASAEDLGGFRRLLLRGDLPKPNAGTKVQLLLPVDEMRTYSPIAAPDGIVLLGWKHAGGPGARWMSEVKAGEEVRFVGPQRSLELAPGPVILVGDETSVAVAAAFAAERPGQVRAVFQVGSVDEVKVAAEAMGLCDATSVPRGGTERVAEAVLAARAMSAGATLAVTGGSELVVATRAALRERGVRDIRTKTYWIPGRAGLD
jgi:NADPH-dependent ferric siderophore reductase